MAEYLGLYYFPYNNGNKYVFPFYNATSDTDRPRFNSGDSFEGSLITTTENGSSNYNNAGVLTLTNNLTMQSDSTTNGSWSFKKNGSTLIPMGGSTGYVTFLFMAKIGDDWYTGWSSQPTAPTSSRSVAIGHASSGKAGYGVVTYNENGYTNPQTLWQKVNDTDMINFLTNNVESYRAETDPYSGAGDSDTGGGGGTFDGSSDPVGVPALPSVGATNTGFISLFVPSQAQLKQVADYLWSPLFDISTFLKVFENPMDCILGLSVVPVTVPTSGSAQITVGNIELSGISLPLASQQYVEIDCGSIPFTDKFFGSYLDQDPYTKMALFVPYSGVHSVKADDIMGKTVNLKYHIDILTGSLVAFLTCGDSVLYEFNGACASNIPVNSMNYASTIENAIRIAVNIGTTVATAGASAPLTGANAATRETARTFGTAVNMAGSTAEGILSLKPNIDRAGSLGGTTGLMGNQTPYFIITRPRLCKPANQNTFKGYPSFIQVTISDLIGEGYTEFDTVVLAGLYLTDGEKEELKQILESGVYL